VFGQELAMPVILSPVGLTGMYARRGEVQAVKAAANKCIPFCLSTVSVCSIEEVASQSPQSIWFQLYVLKDRGFMRNALERAQAAGITTLVFTVDMPTPARATAMLTRVCPGHSRHRGVCCRPSPNRSGPSTWA
jgi:L-lactate dehydrogenase (cytochrome)